MTSHRQIDIAQVSKSSRPQPRSLCRDASRTMTVWSELQRCIGLLDEANDLLFGESALSHVRHSPDDRTSLPLRWYGWWGAGHIQRAAKKSDQGTTYEFLVTAHATSPVSSIAKRNSDDDETFCAGCLILGRCSQDRFGVRACNRQQGARCAAGLLATLFPALQGAN